jgi:two-component system, NarL family, nitrate/nitrite response regulator NarL
MAVRCLLVDDNHDFLKAASDLLGREGITVVGAVATGSEAGRRCCELKPDVALVDIDLGGENGFDVARQLAGCGGHATQVILISSYSGDDFADLIAGSPAISFLPKSALSGEAVRGVLAGAGASAAGGGKAS